MKIAQFRYNIALFVYPGKTDAPVPEIVVKRRGLVADCRFGKAVSSCVRNKKNNPVWAFY